MRTGLVLVRTATRAAAGVSQIVNAPVTLRLSVRPVLRFDYRPSLRVHRERELRTHATVVAASRAAASRAATVPLAPDHRPAPPAAHTMPPARSLVAPRPAVAVPIALRLLRRQRVVDALSRSAPPLGWATGAAPRLADHGKPAPTTRRLRLPAPARLLPELTDLRRRIETAPAAVARQLARGLRRMPSERTAATAPVMTPATKTANGATAAATAAAPLIPLPDFGSLTEQVIREIDRRILAHRERMGRGAY